MRKFSVRWWSGPLLEEWRFMVLIGKYNQPFWEFPGIRNWLESIPARERYFSGPATNPRPISGIQHWIP